MADAPNDRLTKAYHERSHKTITAVQEALQVVADEDLPRLPESIFRDYFLPFFNNELKEESDRRLRLEKWLSVAGNSFHEVIIFNDTTRQPLFKVPAIWDRSVMYKGERRVPLGHIMRSAEQYAMQSPIAGMNFMMDHFEAFKLTDKESEHRAAFLQRWNEILVRYGREKLKAAAPAATAQGATDDDDDDFSFA
jgi:hypothetical protein